MEKILIDLKKLNKKLNYIFKTYGVSEVIKKKVYEAVEKSTIQPTIDPVKHGEWEFGRQHGAAGLQDLPKDMLPFLLSGWKMEFRIGMAEI